MQSSDATVYGAWWRSNPRDMDEDEIREMQIARPDKFEKYFGRKQTLLPPFYSDDSEDEDDDDDDEDEEADEDPADVYPEVDDDDDDDEEADEDEEYDASDDDSDA